MIPLRLSATFSNSDADPFVVKIVDPSHEESSQYFAKPKGENESILISPRNGNFQIHDKIGESLIGDVLLCMPRSESIRRLIRRNSKNNALLFTERCDQLCAMCSQPPRKSDDQWKFPLFRKAVLLADEGMRITITGGEPTLYKKELLDLMGKVNLARPDLSFHVLSNGQHLNDNDLEPLRELFKTTDIVWGVPLYSSKDSLHEEIVGKRNSFNRVLNNLYLLAGAGGQIELRTVLTARNALDLPKLANFIGTHLPFISCWAIMGLEPTGFALKNRDELFFDHSAFPSLLDEVTNISKARDIPLAFYNIPLCTVSPAVRKYCTRSISDWKRKYLSDCDRCAAKESCCGFFEWYNEKWYYSGVAPIEELNPS